MTQSIRNIVLIFIVVHLGGCSIFESDEEGIEGRLSIGFEVSSFRPCDSGENWWVIDESGKIYEQYNRLTDNSYEVIYARLEGIKSRYGEYGHMGAYQREFRVTEIIELRKLTADDCK